MTTTTTTPPMLAVEPGATPGPAHLLQPVGHATFATTPATVQDLARRVGLALALLTTPGDAEAVRDRAVQVLLTGCTEDGASLA